MIDLLSNAYSSSVLLQPSLVDKIKSKSGNKISENHVKESHNQLHQ